MKLLWSRVGIIKRDKIRNETTVEQPLLDKMERLRLK